MIIYLRSVRMRMLDDIPKENVNGLSVISKIHPVHLNITHLITYYTYNITMLLLTIGNHF